ncbi:MAG: C45 family peptidase [Gemmataceae bacterium]
MLDVVCQGSPFEMGRAQGSALAGRIDAARSTLGKIEAFRRQKPWWLPYPLYRLVAGRKARHALGGRVSRDWPDFAARLAGLAQGARASLNNLYLFNALEPLLSSIGGCTACPGACSAVAVRGSRSAGAAPMLARNFDYLPAVQPLYSVRESRPESGRRSLEFTVAPLAGAVDGMNEDGLCITYNYAFATDNAQASGVPLSMLICEALRQCATVADAAAWLERQQRWGGGLLMLADAGGDIASLELSTTRSFLRRPPPGEDCLFHTNDFSAPMMREVQVPDDAVYSAAAPAPLRGRRVHRSSELRNRRFRELLAASGPLDADGLAAIMADHGSDGAPSDFTPCVHGAYWFTTACAQFFPAARRMRVAYSTACQPRFAELAL